MARIRTIKPDFFRSEDVAPLPYRARLTWIGLWTYVDDAGRGKDNARIIKGDLWPLEDKVTHKEVEADLQQLADAGRILRYQVAGERYFLILKWADHQRIAKPSPSKIPPPEASATESKESETIPVGLPEASITITEPLPLGREGEGEMEQGSGKRATRIPKDFTVTEQMYEYAAKNTPNVNIELATEKFINHWTASSGSNATKRDWIAAWRNWMISDQEKAAPRDGGLTTSEKRIRTNLERGQQWGGAVIPEDVFSRKAIGA